MSHRCASLVRPITILLGGLLAACSDNNGPKAWPYPDAAGQYDVVGVFDTVPEAFENGVSVSGTLSIKQANRNVDSLAGRATLVIAYSFRPETVTDVLTFGQVTTDGHIHFSVGLPAESFAWIFDGVSSGDTIVGRHSLGYATTRIHGDFTALRTAHQPVANVTGR